MRYAHSNKSNIVGLKAFLKNRPTHRVEASKKDGVKLGSCLLGGLPAQNSASWFKWRLS